MNKIDKARKALQFMALSEIAHNTGLKMSEVWEYRDHWGAIEKAPKAVINQMAKLYDERRKS